MYLYVPCVRRCPWVPKEGIGYTRARVIDDCEPPCGYRELYSLELPTILLCVSLKY